MANLTILRTYALKDPATLPASILFDHSDKTMTIYDIYPKSIFHFLVLPRVLSSPKETTETEAEKEVSSQVTHPEPTMARTLSVSDLSSLRTLLNSKKVSKEQAKEVIASLKVDALKVKAEIEQEMEKRYGFVWDVWIGFHGAPSMEHIHLHVISGDLISERLKNKKHYNSFHPKLGFFLHVHQVLSWFDAEHSYYQNMAKLAPTKYELLLKEPLSCFHCESEQKNIPTLKTHLQKEWEKHLARTEKQKRLESEKTQHQMSSTPSDLAKSDAGPVHKKRKTSES